MQDSKTRARAVTWADRVPPNTTLTGLVRQRRDGTDRVGPDRTGVPTLTESNEEPAAEVHLACADTQRPALDPSVLGRPDIAGLPLSLIHI